MKLVGFYLPAAEKRALEQLARREHRSVSQLMRFLIEQHSRAVEPEAQPSRRESAQESR
jgi:hypothetical protein